jgi:hypothetical protein
VGSTTPSSTTSSSSSSSSSSSMPSSIEHLTPSPTHRNLIAKTPTTTTTTTSSPRQSKIINNDGRLVVFHAVGTFRNQLREIEFTEASIRNDTVKMVEPSAWEGLMWKASAGLAVATGTSSKRGLVCSVENSRREAILKAASLASMELYQLMLDDRNDAEERTFERELRRGGLNTTNTNDLSGGGIHNGHLTPTRQRTTTTSPHRGGGNGTIADQDHHHQPPRSPAGVHIVATHPNDLSTLSKDVSAAVSGLSSMTAHTHDHLGHHHQHHPPILPTSPLPRRSSLKNSASRRLAALSWDESAPLTLVWCARSLLDGRSSP